jgi:hypothetical protein
MIHSKLQSVDSSAIGKVAYDENKGALYIVFKSSGKAFVYQQVPVESYRSLLTAQSIGKYFAKEIKPRYSWNEVGEEEDVLKAIGKTMKDRDKVRERLDQVAREIDRSGIRAITF